MGALHFYAGDNGPPTPRGQPLLALLYLALFRQTAAVPGYTYVGCYVDWQVINGVSTRDLPEMKSGGSSSMTIPSCATDCAGYKYFGVQFSSQCFCGNAYGSQGKGLESDCNMKCTGDSSTGRVWWIFP